MVNSTLVIYNTVRLTAVLAARHRLSAMSDHCLGRRIYSHSGTAAKYLHYIKNVSYTDKVHALLCMFQIYFHGQDMESLHSHIDPKFLPKRYGGMRPEYRYTDWVATFVNDKAIIAGKYVLLSFRNVKFLILQHHTVFGKTEMPS
jgi:hypothetical protein